MTDAKSDRLQGNTQEKIAFIYQNHSNINHMTRKELAAYFDHTSLKPEATDGDVIRLCQEARENGFFAVCVNPVFVPLAYSLLKESPVKVCTVVGFPLGANRAQIKAAEALQAIKEGASEIDMVIHVGALRAGKMEDLKQDILAVQMACRAKALLKVIIETCLLNDEQKETVCKLAKEIEVDFVKTSTGFSMAGAVVDDVKLMRRTVGQKIGVKASGGIHDLSVALAMIEAGATRLGSSASVKILDELVES